MGKVMQEKCQWWREGRRKRWMIALGNAAWDECKVNMTY